MTCFAGLMLSLVLTGQAQAQSPQTPQTPETARPVDAEVRARFSVTVTASDAITARVYEYLVLVARRNTLRAKFGNPATKAELELVLLFERYPKLPWNRRDIGSVNLRLSPENDTAMVEYCMRRCTEPNPDLVLYTSTLDEFMKRLDAASAPLAKRYR